MDAPFRFARNKEMQHSISKSQGKSVKFGYSLMGREKKEHNLCGCNVREKLN